MKRSWMWLSLCIGACGSGGGAGEPEGDAGGHDEDMIVEEEYGIIDPPDEPVPAIVRGEPLPEAWSRFCVATFTRDFTFKDASGEPVITIQQGEELLLTDLYNVDFGVLVPVSKGMQMHNVAFFDEARPFETNCHPASLTNHVAVFADVTLFEDRELTRPICELERGTTFPFDAWGTVQMFDDQIVQLDIAGWSEPCAGHDVAYFAQGADDVWPMQFILGPGE